MASRLVSEISSGTQFQRTSDESGLADTQTRIFRVLLNNPGDQFNIQDECGVKIGDAHPINTNVFCRSFSANFEGDSRMVVLCTFQYQTLSGSGQQQQDPGGQPPDVRTFDVTTSSSLMEVPVYGWEPITGPDSGGGWIPPVNPAGDTYEGITKLDTVITISVSGFEPSDPLKNAESTGLINSDTVRIGALECWPRTLMFRGLSCQPSAESWGDTLYRGWRATYEFTYRANWVTLNGVDSQIGWDIVVPQTGFNIINRESALGGGVHEVGSLVLKHADYGGKIANWPDDPDLAPGTNGKKVRAMVLVHSYENGGASQTPSAQPIPLNNDGTPRASTAFPKVHVYRYQIYNSVNFNSAFSFLSRLPIPS